MIPTIQLLIEQRAKQLYIIDSAASPHLARPQLVCRPAPESHWHQGIPSIAPCFPNFTSTLRSTRVHSHNYRFLLDVCACVSAQSFPHQRSTHNQRLSPYIVSNADHKHALKTRFLIVLCWSRESYFGRETKFLSKSHTSKPKAALKA